MSNISTLNLSEAVELSKNIAGATASISSSLDSIIDHIDNLQENFTDSSVGRILNETDSLLASLTKSISESFALSDKFIATQYSDYYTTANTLKENYNSILDSISILVSNIDSYLGTDVLDES